MQKGCAQALSAVLLALALSACGYIGDTQSLLRAPMLSVRQSEVYEALEMAQNMDSISYRYIQRGDYRSPFVFFDMDGDGIQEAIVFYYKLNDPANTWTMILRMDSSGQWKPQDDFATSCDQIDFVQFANLLDEESACMIVGWQNTTTQSGRVPGKFLGVYSLSGKGFQVEIDRQDYLEHLVEDFDRDGLDEILVVERREDTYTFYASLLRSAGQRIVKTDTFPLYEQADSLLDITMGRLWDGSAAVYIDELFAQGVAATEILRVGADGLTLLVGGASPSTAEEENAAWEDFTSTFRENTLASRDYDGDGVVEVPATPESLPGTLGEGDEAPLRLTPLMQLTASGLQGMHYSLINETEGYVFFMPDEWITQPVDVARSNDDQEWKFYLLDSSTGVATIELLRLQSYDLAAGTPEAAGTVDLGSRGTRGFAGYIPLPTSDTPAIDESQLHDLFHILS